jgi:hypothetical protein
MNDRLLIRAQGRLSQVLRQLRKGLRWLLLQVPELAPTIQHRRFLTNRPSTTRPTEGATKEERPGRRKGSRGVEMVATGLEPVTSTM